MDNSFQSSNSIAPNYTLPAIDFADQVDQNTTDIATLAERMSRNSERISDNEEGIALAIALSDPDLLGDQQFAMKANFGVFNSSCSLGFTMKGMLNDNLFGNGEVLTVSGGLAYGVNRSTVGGRVSVQIGW
jgi:hypothetical protein